MLHDLETLRAARCYVTLVPARRWLSSADFVRVARIAEVLTYRYSSIANLDAKGLENVYHRAAKVLDESKGEALPEALKILEDAMPDRDTFLAGFMRQRLGVQYLLRFTLRRIEEHVAGETEKQVKPGASVHIEHIMPKKLNAQWRAELPDGGAAHAEYVDKWGNLTLLLYKLNVSATNGTIDQKRKHYQASDVELTKQLAKCDHWDYEAIEARQGWLAEQAEQIWSKQTLAGHAATPAEAATSMFTSRLGLPPDVTERLESLCRESSFHELLEQRARIVGHLSVVELEAAERDDVDVHAAKHVHDLLLRLIQRSGDFDGEQRQLLRGAIEYFVLVDDAAQDLAPDGFADDVRVAEAVADALDVAV